MGLRPDLTKTGVDRTGVGKKRDVNARFPTMRCRAGHACRRERHQPLCLCAGVLQSGRGLGQASGAPFAAALSACKHAFRAAVWLQTARGCLITFDRNRYSVPASFANRPVSLHTLLPSGRDAAVSRRNRPDRGWSPMPFCSWTAQCGP